MAGKRKDSVARGRGRPSFEPTDEQRAQVTALIVFGRTHEDIAKFIGIDTNTLEKHFADQLVKGKSRFQAMATSRLYGAMEKGEAWAVCFYLKTQGKNFGWSERTEHTGADGKDIFAGLDLTKLNASNYEKLKDLLTLAGAAL